MYILSDFIYVQPMQQLHQKSLQCLAYSIQLGLLRYCSTSEMFAETKINGFGAVIRMRDLTVRVRGSINRLLKVIAREWPAQSLMFIQVHVNEHLFLVSSSRSENLVFHFNVNSILTKFHFPYILNNVPLDIRVHY